MAESTSSAQGAGGTSGASGAGDRSTAPAPERVRGASLLPDELEDLPNFFLKEILARVDPSDRAVLAQVGTPWLAAVVAAAAAVDSGLTRAGKSAGVPLKVKDFVGSVGRLAWTKANGCPWVQHMSRHVARGGSLDVLRWARQHGCPWSELTCALAAQGGHKEVLMWLREHGCPRRAVSPPEWAGGSVRTTTQHMLNLLSLLRAYV